MITKIFHIGDILSITTGRLVAPEGMDGIYKILNYLTGYNLYTHQLPWAADECRPWILTQHRQLRDIDNIGLNKDTLPGWLTEQIEKYGECLELRPLPKNIHDFIDPLDEYK